MSKRERVSLSCWISREGVPTEFIEFDHTAEMLARPFEANGKLGACVSIREPFFGGSYPYDVYNGKWRVYVAGNDDFSWTRFVPSPEEAEREVQWLRDHQPVNLHELTDWRDYEFTN